MTWWFRIINGFNAAACNPFMVIHVLIVLTGIWAAWQAQGMPLQAMATGHAA